MKRPRDAVCEESLRIPLMVVLERVGAVPKTTEPLPVSLDKEFERTDESCAVVVARDCASVNRTRDAV